MSADELSEDKSGLYRGLFDPKTGLDEDRAKKVGVMTAQLILNWPRWVHRRVERVSFCDEDALSRNVSVDFTLPHWFHIMRGTDSERKYPKRQLVPLGFRRKGALINFSLDDESKSSLPLLNTHQNTQVATVVLEIMADACLKAYLEGSPVPEPIVRDIEELVREKPGDDKQPKENDLYILKENLFAREDDVQDIRDALKTNIPFLTTAVQFWRSFLALSMIDIRLAERRVLHFSYEESRIHKGGPYPFQRLARGDSSASELIPVNSASEAASYHIEVEAPNGLMIGKCEKHFYMKDPLGKFSIPEEGFSAEVEATSSRAHCHFAWLPPLSGAGVTVELRPRKSSGIRGATLTALLALVTSLAITFRYGYIQGDGDPRTAATLLLAATGIVGFVVVRSGEEPMATTFLFPLRVLSTTPVIFAVCAAVVIIVSPANWIGYTVLGLITALIAFSTGLLMWNWYSIRNVARSKQQADASLTKTMSRG